MQFIFSTGSLYTYSISRCFEFAAQAGFDGIELMVDYRWDTRQADYLQRLIAQYRQPVLAVHSPFAFHVPGWPVDEPGRIQESVKLAEAIGAKVVVHHLPPRLGWTWVQIGHRRIPLPWVSRRLTRTYRAWLLHTYHTYQAGTNVLLCIENMPTRRWLGRRWNGHEWNTVAEIVRFSALTMDTTHLGTWGLDPIDVYPQLQGKVRHIHLSNFNGREHRLPEDGLLSLDRLLAHLAATGYENAISLELHPDALAAGCPDGRVVELLHTSLNHCRSWANL
jgi:sugar phosphate isomerase/epimerase